MTFFYNVVLIKQITEKFIVANYFKSVQICFFLSFFSCVCVCVYVFAFVWESHYWSHEFR